MGDLTSSKLITPVNATSNNLKWLGALRERLFNLGGDTFIDSKSVQLCAQMTARHPAFASLQNARNDDKSVLGQLKDLEHWIDIKTVTKSFNDSTPSLAKIEKVVSYDLQKIRERTVDSDNATYLKGLEVSANVRKGLSSLQRDFIDGIIKGKIDSLKSSRSVTFTVSSHLSSSICTRD